MNYLYTVLCRPISYMFFDLSIKQNWIKVLFLASTSNLLAQRVPLKR